MRGPHPVPFIFMYKDKVIPIIKEAGKKLAGSFGKVEVLNHKDGLPYNVVTELDLETEKYLKKNLNKIYPSIEFFGEEFGGNKEAERYWLVDPIDGTAHFIRGIPFCTLMLALVESGEVVFSAIHNIASGETFWAEKGQGAEKDGKAIRVSSRPLSSAYLTYEISLKKKENVDLFISLKNKYVMFKTVCAGFEFALIAQGKIEGRITIDPWGKEWDYAAGAFLVREAGGTVLNLKKDSYDFKNYNFIAANSIVLKELRYIYKNL